MTEVAFRVELMVTGEAEVREVAAELVRVATKLGIPSGRVAELIAEEGTK